MNTAVPRTRNVNEIPDGEGASGYLAHHLRLDGSRKMAADRLRSRIVLAMALIGVAYCVIAGRLAYFGFMEPGGSASRVLADTTIAARRPDLTDRNGVTLATDINTASLYAEPRRVVDPDEAVEMLARVLREGPWLPPWSRLTRLIVAVARS